jgi:lipopolysaccharide export system permease protein
MQDVLVQDFEKKRLARVSTAKKGRFSEGQWLLEDGKVFEVKPDGTVKALFSFKEQRLTLALSPEEVDRASKRPQEMGLLELFRHIRMAREQGIDTRPMWVIFHMRFAIPWAAVVLALLGTSMGVRSPRGGRGVSLGLSVVVVFGYYVVMSFSRAFGEGGYLNPALSAWLPNLTFLAIGSVMARKANG